MCMILPEINGLRRNIIMKKQKLSTQSLVLVGMFAALISVLAIYQIPTPSGVPMVLTTFIIPMSGYVLGVKKGTLATVIYILLGFIGLPVYAGMKAGPSVLFGITGGFLFGYITFAALAGVGTIIRSGAIKTGLGTKANNILAIVCGILGLLSCHLLGTIQYALLTGTGIIQAMLLVSLPYMIKDIIFTLAAYFVAMAVRKGLLAANIISYNC